MSLMNRKRGTSICLALLCSGVVMATGALAETITESMIVKYVPGELNTREGAEAVYKRIKRAARLVCHQPAIHQLTEYTLYQQCFDHAVDAAVANAHSTELTALHHTRMQRAATG